MALMGVLLILVPGVLLLLGLQVALCLLCKPLWPGLVLPGLCVLFAAFLTLNVMSTGSLFQDLVTMLLVFVLGNVSTLVLLLILLLCRKGRSSKKQLDKMNIQDL